MKRVNVTIAIAGAALAIAAIVGFAVVLAIGPINYDGPHFQFGDDL